MLIVRLLVAIVLGLPAVVMSPPALQAQSQSHDAVEDPLMPGDAVRLVFWREPGFNGDYPVDDAGVASLPLLGLTEVTTLGPSALRSELLSRYGRELRDQEVQITFLRRIRILGAVRTPGLYHIDPTMSLADAVALAGGATEDGRLTDIEVHRDGERVLTDLELGDRAIGMLQSGDQITVPERAWLSRNGTVLLGTLISAGAIIVSRLIN